MMFLEGIADLMVLPYSPVNTVLMTLILSAKLIVKKNGFEVLLNKLCGFE